LLFRLYKSVATTSFLQTDKQKKVTKRAF
jgi:hypothetical protein